MARFRPFCGVRFVPEKVGSFDGVVTPPYDVISVEHRDELYAASPYNVTRLILNPRGHAEAARIYRAWLSEGVLVREHAPVFYLYRQDFECHGARSRTGVIGALHLEPFSSGVVRPHERTFAHHKRDRLELTVQVKANLSPIFGLYSNPRFEATPDGGWEAEPDVDVVHEGVRNRLWVVRSRRSLERIATEVADRTVFIADGHHRYETALAYHDFAFPGEPLAATDGPDDTQSPASHVLAFLARFEDPGMLILPTHRELASSGGADHERFVEQLGRRFEIERIAKSAAGRMRLLAALDERGHDNNVFGVALRDLDDYLLVRRRGSAQEGGSYVSGLDVAVLHSAILEDALVAAGAKEPKIEYSAAADRVLDRVDDGITEGAFLLRPMLAEQLSEACMAGELMPHKSTYFYPKLLTGLVFHALER